MRGGRVASRGFRSLDFVELFRVLADGVSIVEGGFFLERGFVFELNNPAARDQSLKHRELHQVVEGLILRVGGFELEFEQTLANLRGLFSQRRLVLIPALNNRPRDGVVERGEKRVSVGVEDVEGSLRGLGFAGSPGFVELHDALADFAESLFPANRGLDLRKPDLNGGLRVHHFTP